MALAIELDPHNTGTPAKYWRITQTHLDHAQGQVTVWLHGWLHAAARAQGRAATAAFSLVLQAEDLAGDLHNVTTGKLYTALKARAAQAAQHTDHAVQAAVATIDHAILADAADA